MAWSDVEVRSRRRYLDLIVNEEAREVALRRVSVLRALRKCVRRPGFPRGGDADPATAGRGRARPSLRHPSQRTRCRHVSPHRPRTAAERLVVGGLERVFELGRVFRNEGIDSTHNPEFTMLEAYQAFADYEDVLGLVESVIAEVVAATMGGTELTYQGRPLDLTPPYRRARYLDLVQEAVNEASASRLRCMS